MRVVWRAQNKRMHHSLWCRLRLPGKGLIGIRMLHMFAFTLHCNRHKNQNQLLINAWQRAQWHRIYRQKKKKYHIIRKQIYLLIVNKNNGLTQHMCQFNEMCHLLLMEMHSQCCFLCVLCAPNYRSTFAHAFALEQLFFPDGPIKNASVEQPLAYCIMHRNQVQIAQVVAHKCVCQSLCLWMLFVCHCESNWFRLVAV